MKNGDRIQIAYRPDAKNWDLDCIVKNYNHEHQILEFYVLNGDWSGYLDFTDNQVYITDMGKRSGINGYIWSNSNQEELLLLLL